MDFRVSKTELVFEREWFHIRLDQLTNDKGMERTYPTAEIKPAAAVLGFDDENQVILQREYRHTLRRWCIEISSGGIDPKEDPMKAAAREFSEETGYTIEKMEKVGVWNALTGKCAADVHMYLGRVKKTPLVPQHLDKFEIIEPFRVPAKEAVKMVLDGRITNAEHIALLLVAKEKHPEWFE